MGCDIHAHTEIKVLGSWHHYGHPRIQRDYDLFARMANVRNYGAIEPIALPRGLPTDLSFTTRLCADHDGSDGHSHSWLSGEEVAQLAEWAETAHKTRSNEWFNFEHEVIGYIFGNGWDIKKYHTDYPEWLQDVRLVFWFDN